MFNTRVINLIILITAVVGVSELLLDNFPCNGSRKLIEIMAKGYKKEV